jgi:hypothetical protein
MRGLLFELATSCYMMILLAVEALSGYLRLLVLLLFSFLWKTSVRFLGPHRCPAYTSLESSTSDQVHSTTKGSRQCGEPLLCELTIGPYISQFVTTTTTTTTLLHDDTFNHTYLRP